jgi:hypothetical protein
MDIARDESAFSTGWSGQAHPQWAKEVIIEKWRDGSIKQEAIHHFLHLAYEIMER